MDTRNPSEPFAAWHQQDGKIEYRVSELEDDTDRRFRYIVESRRTAFFTYNDPFSGLPSVVEETTVYPWSKGCRFFPSRESAMLAILTNTTLVRPLTDEARELLHLAVNVGREMLEAA